MPDASSAMGAKHRTSGVRLLGEEERERETERARLLKENLGDFAPSEVVAPRSDGAARTANVEAYIGFYPPLHSTPTFENIATGNVRES